MLHQQENISPQKMRESSFELLRLLSMLLVMAVHANFWSLGAPTSEDMHTAFASSLSRVIVESLSIICVNVFILISGWFGIKVTTNKLLSFLFQIFYFNLLMFFIWVVVFGNKVSIVDAFKYFFLLTERYWFIKVYLALFIISPCLNLFIEKYDKRECQIFLLAIFIFQSIYGWIWPSVTWISKGYSLFTMAFLYMLARYMKKYAPLLGWSFSCRIHLIIYLIVSFTIAGLYSLLTYYDFKGEALFAYSCPLVILSSIHFFLVFSKIHFTNKLVNYIAASTFAIYLFHGNPMTADVFYRTKISNWFIEDPTLFFLGKTLTLICMFFVGAIVLDLPRRWIWSKIEHHIIDCSMRIPSGS